MAEEQLNAFEKNMAAMRGEVLAAEILAALAIRAVLMFTPNPKEVLAGMSAYVEDTLNMSGPARGDADDAFNTQMRETARFRALQQLDGIAQSLRNSPTKEK